MHRPDVRRLAVKGAKEPIVIAVGVEHVELGPIDFPECSREPKGTEAFASIYGDDGIKRVFRGRTQGVDSDTVPPANECIGHVMGLVASANFGAAGEVVGDHPDVQGADGQE